jgi:serine protease Do
MRSAGSDAATPSPELQKRVQGATFEVVIRKPEKDTATYEKPLPMELVPFIERNDKYWSVGTAFAIAPNTFVTAAHVILQGVGSQFGTPAIRDVAGAVYTVDKVLKFSLHEDFAVFSVINPPAVAVLETAAAPPLNEPVFAVGNALGEGVVIRDGLYTSQTPEQQDGRWKWLRFSAAASPGNSGGPLLDLQGRAIGVVIAKSPNENLNYALPIEHVTDNPGKLAAFDVRTAFAQPMVLQGQTVSEFKDSFALPLPFAEFSQAYLIAFNRYFREAQAQLLTSRASELFPHGNSVVPLARLYSSFDPSVLSQKEDRSWDVHSCANGESETTLPPDGRVWTCHGDASSPSLFRLQYPGTDFQASHYADSRAFMDLLLKAVPVPRMVGTEPVRVTSLGNAQSEALVRDRFGRIWQQRVWSLGFADASLVTFALPTPDGYVGMISMAPRGLLEPSSVTFRFLADYIFLSYSGSLPQWSAFLNRTDLRPATFEHLKLHYALGKGLQIESPRWRLDSTGLLAATDHSLLELEMTYMLDPAGLLVWDVGGVVLRADRDGKTMVAAYRQPKPGDGAGEALRARWEHMTRRDAEFSGEARPLGNRVYDVHLVAAGGGPSPPPGATAGKALYELVYVTDSALVPRDLEASAARLRQGFQVTE